MSKNILRKIIKNYKNFIIFFGLVIVAALIYVLIFVWMPMRGRAGQAIAEGRIEIASEAEIDNYFVFLPLERVEYLLQKSDGKFLFPQVDLALADGASFIAQVQEFNMEEHPIKMLTLHGLSVGARVYSSISGFIRGGVIGPSDAHPYMWAEIIEYGESPHIVLTYIPVLNIQTDNPSVAVELREGLRVPIKLGEHFATILTNNTVPLEVAPGQANIAMVITGADGIYTALSLQNILTYRGRIVMIAQAE